jgi:predicted Zn-dependent protease
MASRDLTVVYYERRTAALKRRTAGGGGQGGDTGNGLNGSSSRLTAGGTITEMDAGHSLMLMEVREVIFINNMVDFQNRKETNFDGGLLR